MVTKEVITRKDKPLLVVCVCFFFFQTVIYITEFLIHRECLFWSERLCVCYAQIEYQNHWHSGFYILNFNLVARSWKDSATVTTAQHGFELFTAAFQCRNLGHLASHCSATSVQGLLSR